MNWLSAETLIALATLTFLEIVLGVDNIIFISILSGRLPQARQASARRLGLLVVDEEHRFGVRDKERLKALRAEVHVLTLTATPIPRTLNMALGGLRDEVGRARGRRAAVAARGQGERHDDADRNQGTFFRTGC
jgi:superfamily II DNA or RNA helicase